MDLNRKQSQFELFPATTENLNDAKKGGYLFKDLTLSLENIIVVCIIFVMILVLAFSFGVEKGRRFDQANEYSVKKVIPVVKTRMPESSLTTIQNNVAPITRTGTRSALTQPIYPDPGLQTRQTIEKALSGVPQAIETSQPEMPAKTLKNDLFGQYTIQVASFKEEKYARQEAMKLKQNGHDIFIMPKGQHSIVCVGKFGKKNEAETYSNKLKNKYGDCLVRRL
jgi:cell division septation protein DedD